MLHSYIYVCILCISNPHHYNCNHKSTPSLRKLPTCTYVRKFWSQKIVLNLLGQCTTFLKQTALVIESKIVFYKKSKIVFFSLAIESKVVFILLIITCCANNQRLMKWLFVMVSLPPFVFMTSTKMYFSVIFY